jgi:hypothetical protein
MTDEGSHSHDDHDGHDHGNDGANNNNNNNNPDNNVGNGNGQVIGMGMGVMEEPHTPLSPNGANSVPHSPPDTSRVAAFTDGNGNGNGDGDRRREGQGEEEHAADDDAEGHIINERSNNNGSHGNGNGMSSSVSGVRDGIGQSRGHSRVSSLAATAAPAERLIADMMMRNNNGADDMTMTMAATTTTAATEGGGGREDSKGDGKEVVQSRPSSRAGVAQPRPRSNNGHSRSSSPLVGSNGVPPLAIGNAIAHSRSSSRASSVSATNTNPNVDSRAANQRSIARVISSNGNITHNNNNNDNDGNAQGGSVPSPTSAAVYPTGMPIGGVSENGNGVDDAAPLTATPTAAATKSMEHDEQLQQRALHHDDNDDHDDDDNQLGARAHAHGDGDDGRARLPAAVDRHRSLSPHPTAAPVGGARSLATYQINKGIISDYMLEGCSLIITFYRRQQ